ncbi:MAG: N-acetylneuraminate synthase family protein [Bdellovibrionota bacterium]|nr:N-acetylneuraminate synthase family protein [Bdellovibrionota bacterium]
MKDLEIGKFKIGYEHDIVIIAEVGINHEGSIESCLEHIKEAANAGAHVIKLQTVDADENYVEGTPSYEIFKKAFLDKEETQRAFDYTRELGMEPMTTFGDFKTLEWHKDLAPPAYKISSGLLTTMPIIEKIATLDKSILLSTGMANHQDVKNELDTIKKYHINYGVFQCTSSYPCPLESLNLSYMDVLRKDFECHVGFSDHSLGVDGSLWAIARGAQFIEKHFSLDSKRNGFDHKISLNPIELKELCEKSKMVKSALGSGKKSIDDEMKKKRAFFQRCLVAREDIKAGDIFTEDNLTFKRPLENKRGLEPSFYERLLGKKSENNYFKNDPIEENVSTS